MNQQHEYRRIIIDINDRDASALRWRNPKELLEALGIITVQYPGATQAERDELMQNAIEAFEKSHRILDKPTSNTEADFPSEKTSS